MSKSAIAAALALMSAASVSAVDWSGWQTIVRIESHFSSTLYYLSGGEACNGTHDGLPRWELRESDATNGAEGLKHKKALLLAAYTAGDRVNFRCEGRLTDFTVRKD